MLRVGGNPGGFWRESWGFASLAADTLLVADVLIPIPPPEGPTDGSCRSRSVKSTVGDVDAEQAIELFSEMFSSEAIEDFSVALFAFKGAPWALSIDKGGG